MQLTYGKVIMALVFIGFSFFVMQIVPSGDCTTLYKTQDDIKKCNAMQTIGLIVVIMTVIFVMLIVITSIFSKPEQDIRNKLADNSGPAHGTLPKGYDDKQNSSEVNK